MTLKHDSSGWVWFKTMVSEKEQDRMIAEAAKEIEELEGKE